MNDRFDKQSDNDRERSLTSALTIQLPINPMLKAPKYGVATTITHIAVTEHEGNLILTFAHRATNRINSARVITFTTVILLMCKAIAVRSHRMNTFRL